MKILRMKARFGRLSDDEIRLSEGLNILTAPNESGKSTWCAFIASMLYGIDTSKRESAGYLPDKVRYQPVSGAGMQGEMDIVSGGEYITISRSTSHSGSPMKDFSACYTGTALAVKGLDSAGCGELLTGMTRDVFNDTVRIGGDLSVQSGPELERRIAAITTTGSEGASWSEISSRLRMWQRARYHNKSSGAIPALEEESEKLRTTLQIMERAALEEARLQSEISAAEDSARETDLLRQARSEALNAELTQARLDLGEAQIRLGEARAQYAAAEEALNEAEFSRPIPDADLGRKRRIIMAWGIILLILGLSALIMLLVWGAGSLRALAAVPVILGAVLLARDFTRSSVTGSHLQSSDEDTHRLSATYAEKKAVLDEAESTLREIQGKIDFISASSQGEEKSPEASADDLRLTLERLRGRAEALGDPLEIASRLKENEDKLIRYNSEYEAIGMALDVLSAADTELTSRFSPALSEKASEYMSRLTAGRYDRLTFDRNLKALARPSGGIGNLSALVLSAGTADQLYLSLRLAIAELTDSGDDKCPLILDDALITFDDERMSLALSLLKEISETRQVIIFTCHGREKKWLETHC